MVNYPVGDALVSIKNAAMGKKSTVEVKSTAYIASVLDVLKAGRFIAGYKKDGGKIVVETAFKKGRPMIMDLKLISKPGLRIYRNWDQLTSRRSPSRYIVSTPKGVMFDSQCIKEKLGGEVIVEIW